MTLIDISHILDHNTPVYPGDYDTSLTLDKTPEKDQYTAYLLKSCMHTGTHVDTPMHLTRDMRTIPEFTLECFTGNGILLDVRGENPVQMQDEYKHKVNEGDIVLLYTGFDQYYYSGRYFTEYPSVDEELAEFLISKKIKMLGMDTPAPDYTPFPIHKMLFMQDILILENLTKLGSLLDIPSFEVFAFPLKIRAEASFVRAICRIN